MKKISYEEFVNTYKPRQNPYINAPFNGCMFETYAQEHAYIKTVKDNHIWTLINAEGLWILPGYRFVDRLGYFVTDIPWEDQNIEVDVEIKKYKRQQNAED